MRGAREKTKVLLLEAFLLFESGAFLVHKKSKLAAEGWRERFLVREMREVLRVVGS